MFRPLQSQVLQVVQEGARREWREDGAKWAPGPDSVLRQACAAHLMRVWHMAHFMAMFFMCFFRGDLFHRAYFMAMFFMCLDVRCTHERSGSTGVHCMYIGSTLGRKVSNDLQMAMLRRLHESSGSSGTLCIYTGPMLGRKYSILGLE